MILSLEGKDTSHLECNFNPPVSASALGLIKFFMIIGDKLPPPNGHKVISSVTITTNITGGASVNGKKAHFIQKFPVRVNLEGLNPVYISEYEPKNIIYFPTTQESISNIQVKLLDQDGRELKQELFTTILLDLE